MLTKNKNIRSTEYIKKLRCSVRGCKNKTNSYVSKKPYCSEHFLVYSKKLKEDNG